MTVPQKLSMIWLTIAFIAGAVGFATDTDTSLVICTSLVIASIWRAVEHVLSSKYTIKIDEHV